MLTRGWLLTPQQVLKFVEDEEDPSESDEPAVGLYRRKDGRAYALGLREDRLSWLSCRFQSMGSLALVRRQREIAQREGIRKRSLFRYLLTDVEREGSCGMVSNDKHGEWTPDP